MSYYIFQINENNIDVYINNIFDKTIDINENPIKHFSNTKIKHCILIYNIHKDNSCLVKSIPKDIGYINKLLFIKNQYKFFQQNFQVFTYTEIDNYITFLGINCYDNHKTWFDYILQNFNIIKIYSSMLIQFSMLNDFYKNISQDLKLIEIENKDKKLHFFINKTNLILFRYLDEYKNMSFDDYITENNIEETLKYISQEINDLHQDQLIENTKIIVINQVKLKEILNYFSINEDDFDKSYVQYIYNKNSIEYFTKNFHLNNFLKRLPKTIITITLLIFIFLSFNIYKNTNDIEDLSSNINEIKLKNNSLITKCDISILEINNYIKISKMLEKSGFDYNDIEYINMSLISILPKNIFINNLEILYENSTIIILFKISKTYGHKIQGIIENNLKNIKYIYYDISEENLNSVFKIVLERK